ncbi:four-carbon acid sugar kinase family protein [Bacillus sp. 1P06AnD]|uniref:four-carbon acid sugar kinase family protein n=1 Tax=Bacillus sp. 1P06AnD TaxID=3132208 RepID=UPI00399F2605
MNADILTAQKEIDRKAIDGLLQQSLQDLNKKIIVLDDDPTGVQTVHDISVYTDWTEESLTKAFQEENSMFFILTNSRGFTAAETEAAHTDIANMVVKVANAQKKDFLIISRGDSTLRGHYPLETETLRKTVEAATEKVFDGEILLPFFKEGGRYTMNNIHYVQNGDELIPAGETEFAKDRTFGYTKSHLGEWIEEKTNGAYKAADAAYISLDDIRSMNIDSITGQLMNVKDFGKVIVNAIDEYDVKIFTIALVNCLKKGKNFLFRSAAALPKVIGGVDNRPLLTREELIKEETGNGGLIIIGSHVKKTTEQLDELKKLEDITFIEFNSHLVLQKDKFKEECDRVIENCETLISSGKTVAVYTSRERLDLGPDRKEEELKMSVEISDAVTSIVTRLQVKPNFLIAKGGITSSDVGTKGLRVKRATVLGQVKPGIPVWLTGNESKFPGMSYVIFPGNVGTKTDLKDVVDMLQHN